MSLFSGVHPADAQGECLVADIAVAARAQNMLKFSLPREIEYRSRKVSVGCLVSRDLASDNRQYMNEIQFEKPAQNRIGRNGKFQNHKFSARAQYPEHFTETSLPVLEISHPESYSYSVETSVIETELFAVTLLAGHNFFESFRLHFLRH